MFGFGKSPSKLAICYIRRQQVFVHASSKTVAGFYTATPPWLAADIADSGGLDACIEAALAGSKANVPTPDRDANPVLALYRLAGVNTWNRFVLDAKSVHVEQSGKVRTFRPMKDLGPRSGFQPIPELSFEVGPDERASSALFRAIELAE